MDKSGLQNPCRQIAQVNRHCQVCEEYTNCNGDCPGYDGGIARPTCFQQAQSLPGPVDPETGEENGGGVPPHPYRQNGRANAADTQVPPRLTAAGPVAIGAAAGRVSSFPAGAACPLRRELNTTAALRSLFGRIHGLEIVPVR